MKALLNLYAGKWGEVYGRKPVLLLGWATALQLPVILIFAPSWAWISVGNILLGIRQRLTWAWATAVLAAVVGLALALPMHYTADAFAHNWVTHLAPVYLATIIFVVGAVLSYRE